MKEGITDSIKTSIFKLKLRNLKYENLFKTQFFLIKTLLHRLNKEIELIFMLFTLEKRFGTKEIFLLNFNDYSFSFVHRVLLWYKFS